MSKCHYLIGKREHMKRANSKKCSKQEIRANAYKNYAAIDSNKSRINPIFLRAHYPEYKGGNRNVN